MQTVKVRYTFKMHETPDLRIYLHDRFHFQKGKKSRKTTLEKKRLTFFYSSIKKKDS